MLSTSTALSYLILCPCYSLRQRSSSSKNYFRRWLLVCVFTNLKSLGIAVPPEASRLYFLLCLTRCSTSLMRRRQSSSCHGRATHCTATGRPSPPDTAWAQTHTPSQSTVSNHHSLLPPPADQLWKYTFKRGTYLLEELVPAVLIKALIVLELLLILCSHRGNRNYTGRKGQEIVNHRVRENSWKERQQEEVSHWDPLGFITVLISFLCCNTVTLFFIILANNYVTSMFASSCNYQ